jgi:hypothetical protein
MYLVKEYGTDKEINLISFLFSNLFAQNQGAFLYYSGKNSTKQLFN